MDSANRVINRDLANVAIGGKHSVSCYVYNEQVITRVYYRGILVDESILDLPSSGRRRALDHRIETAPAVGGYDTPNPPVRNDSLRERPNRPASSSAVFIVDLTEDDDEALPEITWAPKKRRRRIVESEDEDSDEDSELPEEDKEDFSSGLVNFDSDSDDSEW